MSNILVTGANGFVGRHVCRYLQTRGHDVRGAVRAVNDASIGCEPVVVGDIAECPDWSPVLGNTDAIIHLAARVHRRRTNPDAYRRINVDATLELARAAIESGVAQFIFLSSIAVNGARTTSKPFDDEDAPAPCNAYGRSKLEAERGLSVLAESSGLNLTVIRPPMVYGPGAPGNFAALLGWVRSGLPLPLGKIANRRSFIGIDNLCSVLAACIDQAAVQDRCFCVADGEDISTPELVRLIAGALSRPARLLDVPVPVLRALGSLTGQRRRIDSLCDSLQIDASRARSALAWSPPTSLEAGLRNALEHC